MDVMFNWASIRERNEEPAYSSWCRNSNTPIQSKFALVEASDWEDIDKSVLTVVCYKHNASRRFNRWALMPMFRVKSLEEWM